MSVPIRGQVFLCVLRVFAVIPMTILAKAAVFLVAVYAGFALLAWFIGERVIFQPRRASYRDTAEILKITTRNGKRISALYLASPAARYTLLVSHGNAEDLGDDREWYDDLRGAGFNVLAYDYEGYGTSEGRPSERASYEDEQAAYDYLTGTL